MGSQLNGDMNDKNVQFLGIFHGSTMGFEHWLNMGMQWADEPLVGGGASPYWIVDGGPIQKMG
jgi:hypothetical protein